MIQCNAPLRPQWATELPLAPVVIGIPQPLTIKAPDRGPESMANSCLGLSGPGSGA